MNKKADSIAHTDILPSHLPLDIWEVYASLVLQHIDSATYTGLSYGDKPDLYDDSASLGVEVTQAIPPNNQEADALYAKLQLVHDEQTHDRLIERIEQVGGKVESWGLFGPNGADSFDLILKAFQSKLDKLNAGGYKPLEHNHLFVLSNILADNSMLENALQRFKELNYLAIAFERIVISVPGRNYDFDLIKKRVVEHPFGMREQCDIAERSREIVIAAAQGYAAK